MFSECCCSGLCREGHKLVHEEVEGLCKAGPRVGWQRLPVRPVVRRGGSGCTSLAQPSWPPPRVPCPMCPHRGPNGIISFFFMAEKYSIVYIHHIFFIRSSVDGRVGCFQVLAVANSAAVDIRARGSFSRKVSSGYVPEWDGWATWRVHVQFSKAPPCCSPQWLNRLPLPPTEQEGPSSPRPLQHLLSGD